MSAQQQPGQWTPIELGPGRWIVTRILSHFPLMHEELGGHYESEAAALAAIAMANRRPA